MLVSWIVPIQGHQFDLDDLPLWTSSSRISVAKRDDGYYLVLPIALVGADPRHVREVAREFIEQLNGVGKVLDNTFEPIQVTDALYGIDEAGERRNTVLTVQGARLRMKLGHVTLSLGGKAQPDTRHEAATALLEAAELSGAARDALVIVGRHVPTWTELYVAFELVEANAGGTMFAEGWISRADATLFTRTANSYTALGRLARHGKEKSKAPDNPMLLPRATTLVRQLVGGWLRSLLNPPAQGAG